MVIGPVGEVDEPTQHRKSRFAGHRQDTEREALSQLKTSLKTASPLSAGGKPL
jgi:hypothetical protein